MSRKPAVDPALGIGLRERPRLPLLIRTEAVPAIIAYGLYQRPERPFTS
jgi:hypothetical protein